MNEYKSLIFGYSNSYICEVQQARINSRWMQINLYLTLLGKVLYQVPLITYQKKFPRPRISPNYQS